MSLILNGTTGISDVDGTAAAPALTGTDSNTGIFFPAADTIAFAEGGVEAVRIDSSSNVGIGTTTPDIIGYGAGNTTLGTKSNATFYPNIQIGTVGVAAATTTILGDYNFYGLNGGSSVVARSLIRSRLDGATDATNMTFINYIGGVGTERVRIDSSGNVGIGTSSPQGKLDVRAGTGATLFVTADATNLLALNNYNATSGFQNMKFAGSTHQFFTGTAGGGSAAEAGRFDASGNLLVGTTSSGSGSTTGAIRVSRTSANGVYSEAVTTSSGYRFISNALTDGGTFFHVNFMENGTQRGSITSNGSSTSYTTTSDYRLKEAITPMTGALAKVALLKPCTYKWKVDGSDGQGFIAHELDEVVSGCVTGEKDAVQEEQYEVTPAVKDADGNTITEAVMGTRMAPQYQGIDTSFLVATLSAAIQELHALVKTQDSTITALTARITALEAI